jgi:hypothetical protein
LPAGHGAGFSIQRANLQKEETMAEHQSNRASPAVAATEACEWNPSSSTDQVKATARETTEELRRKGAEMAQETKETARHLKDEAVHSATEAARQAQHQAADYADAQKGRVADELRTFGEAISRAADKLREEQDVRAAGYADMAADQLASAADYLRTRNLGDLMGDMETFARRRPEIFFGATFLVGMGIARFLKASSRRPGLRDDRHFDDDDYYPPMRTASQEAAGSQPGAWSQAEQRSRPQSEQWSPSQQSSNLAGMNDPLSYH